MRVRLIVPQVKTHPSSRAGECPRCHSHSLHVHQKVTKQVIDPQICQVRPLRYKCTECGRTFRHYPEG